MSFSMLVLETHEQHINSNPNQKQIEFSGVPVTRVACAAPSAPKHTMVESLGSTLYSQQQQTGFL